MTSHYDRDTLIDYLHGALDANADARVFAHLDACADCRAVHDEEAAIGELLRSAAQADERELPSMVKARIWDAVRRERPSFGQRLLTGWGPRLALPVAAALALVAYLGVPAMRGPQTPSGVSAVFYLNEHNATVQNPLGQGVSPAVYGPEQSTANEAAAAAYIDTADAATLDSADGATP